MSISRKYLESIATELNHFGVWPPGDPLRVGDYGIIEGSHFLKLGHASAFGAQPAVNSVNIGFWEYASQNVSIRAIEAKAGAESQELMSNASAGVHLHFGKAYSLFVRVAGGEWVSMTNLRDVAVALLKGSVWNPKWFIVYRCHNAKNLILMMNSAANANISLTGSADVLHLLQRGELGGGTELHVTGDVAFKCLGVAGPFILDLVRVKDIRSMLNAPRYAIGGEDVHTDNLIEHVDPVQLMQPS